MPSQPLGGGTLRRGLTIGNVFVDNAITFGPALIRAFARENDVSISPQVIAGFAGTLPQVLARLVEGGRTQNVHVRRQVAGLKQLDERPGDGTIAHIVLIPRQTTSRRLTRSLRRPAAGCGSGSRLSRRSRLRWCARKAPVCGLHRASQGGRTSGSSARTRNMAKGAQGRFTQRIAFSESRR